jgi:hypothetical protein
VNPVSWPLQRIHTQNPQSNVCWRNKEHTSQTLLPPHGNNVRDSPQTRMWPTSSEDPVPHPKSQIQQNEQEQTFPHQVQPGHVPTQWVRTIRELDPVWGLTPPSIPPPFLWCEEKYRQTFFPRDMEWFIWYCIS